MSYVRFALMIATSTIVMFVLMYLNTYALEHVFFSETRVYMAIMMGAVMAAVMLAFMLGMYANRSLNVAIFALAGVVFAGSLWLVRSQETVSGVSYMRAMIPHHSIAIMTSGRAQISDPRVRKLADEIIEAQEREIAEMRSMIADISEGRMVSDIYEDPPAHPGSVDDALSNTLVSRLDLAPIDKAEADQLLPPGPRCEFRRSLDADPVLWTNADGRSGAIKLNGILIGLEADEETSGADRTLAADGTAVTVHPLGDDADWRSDADLRFELDAGLKVGYRGFYGCDA